MAAATDVPLATNMCTTSFEDLPGSVRTIGLIGGMSWESTLPYYRLVNERVRIRRGSIRVTS